MALSQNEWVGLLPPGTHSSPTTLAFLLPLSNSWLVGCGGVWWASLTDSGWLRLDLPFPSPSLSPLPPPPHIPWKWKLWLWLCKMWNLGDSKKWSFAILLFCFPEFVVTSSCHRTNVPSILTSLVPNLSHPLTYYKHLKLEEVWEPGNKATYCFLFQGEEDCPVQSFPTPAHCLLNMEPFDCPRSLRSINHTEFMMTTPS